MGEIPIEGKDLHGHALVNNVVESPDGLLHRGETVRTVGVHDVHILEVQTLQGSLEPLNDVFPRETVVVDEDLTIYGAPVDLVAGSVSVKVSPQGHLPGAR